MKKQLSLVMVVMMLQWFVASGVQAESVTVTLSAVVNGIYDPAGVIGDTIPVGSEISGTYIYETTTPDQDPSVELGFYPHAAGNGYLNLVVGPYQIQTNTTLDNAFEMYIEDEFSPGYEVYSVKSYQLLPDNGATFYYASLDLAALDAFVLQSSELTATLPDYHNFTMLKSVHVEGIKDGEIFYINADLVGLTSDSQNQAVEPVVQEGRYEYRANAVVTYIDDPAGVLSGKVDINSAITAGFVYDMATPNSSSFPEEGTYLHTPGTGEVSVAFSDVSLSTDPTAMTPEVRVIDADTSNWNHMGILGHSVISNNTMITAYNVGIFFDGPSAALNSIEMPAGTLSLQDWYDARVVVSGEGWGFDAVITSLELIKVPVFEVFPPAGTVHPLQHFDMAFRVNNQAIVTGINGMNNDQDISYYLSGCAVLPKFDLTQSIVCPDTTSILMPGDNAIQFELMLEDGSVLDTSVSWEVRD